MQHKNTDSLYKQTMEYYEKGIQLFVSAEMRDSVFTVTEINRPTVPVITLGRVSIEFLSYQPKK